MRCPNRRSFLAGSVASAIPVISLQAAPVLSQAEGESWRAVAAGGMVFRWRHRNGALQGRLIAPTPGWLAVGFNDARRLKGTCFVMAQLSEAPARMELRRAAVPDHAPVRDRRIGASLTMEAGAFRDGLSQLQFTLPHASGTALDVKLTPGAATYLMLAWSRSPDFDHHSAFREHQGVQL